MKKLLIVAALIPGLAAAQVSPGFVSGQVLTAGALNSAFAQAVNTANGSATGLSLTGGSITALSSPLGIGSGGTGSTVAGGATLDTISGLSGLGFLTRTGAGAYAFQSLTNGISFANLAQVGANSLLGNAGATAANASSQAMPSCSTSASALTWTTSSGMGCNTAVNAAQLNGATFAAPGAIGGTTPGSGAFTTISATGAITPSQTSGIVGTTTNNSANAGAVGEFLSSNVPSGSQVALTAATPANITSLPITAGDWMVCANVVFNPAGTTTTSYVIASISTTSATQATPPNGGAYVQMSSAVPAGLVTALSTGCQRQLVSGSTTLFLVITANFSVSTGSAYGFIGARRMR